MDATLYWVVGGTPQGNKRTPMQDKYWTSTLTEQWKAPQGLQPDASATFNQILSMPRNTSGTLIEEEIVSLHGSDCVAVKTPTYYAFICSFL